MTNQLTRIDIATSTTARRPTRTTTSKIEVQPKRPSGGRRWILLVGGAALAVAAVVGFAATGNDPALTERDSAADSTDPNGVSDGSFDQAEANRFGTLRDLVTGR